MIVISARLQVAKAIVIPKLTTISRTRTWTRKELDAVQRVASYAVRRCMGMDKLNMRALHISDHMLYQAARWDTVEDLVCKHTLHWLGRVASMSIARRPKQVIFGWIGNPRRN